MQPIQPMQIDVYGLGYVGSVTSLALASLGHQVRGLERVSEKVELFLSGKLPVFEPGLDRLFETKRDKDHENGPAFRVELQSATAEPLSNKFPDAVLVCVGTPSLPGGGTDLNQLEETVRGIGNRLVHAVAQARAGTETPLVIIRSTIPPGTLEQCVRPILEKAIGRPLGDGWDLCFYPEFLREGKALDDFFAPSLNVVGICESPDAPSSVRIVKKIQALFPVDRPLQSVHVSTAEMIKYANNTFHALKVAFGNELGSLAHAYGVNTEELTRIFVSDTTLNISPTYLRPGFSFGGSCLPKELRAVQSLARDQGLRLPLLESVLSSNEAHTARLLRLLEENSAGKIGFLGVTFKPDTDDLRESPLLDVLERMTRGPSYKSKQEIWVCDRADVQKRLEARGLKNPKYTQSPSDLFRSCQVVVLGPYRLDDEAIRLAEKFDGMVIDLKWHAVSPQIHARPGYRTIC